jgi:hypothetical protein
MASGGSQRASYFLKLINRDIKLTTIFVLGPNYQENSAVFAPAARSVAQNDVRNEIKKLASESKSQGVDLFSVFLDASCLSRQQLGEVMAAVRDIALTGVVELRIGYCLGRFTPPPNQTTSHVRRIAPVNSAFSGWTKSPGKPVDIVLGLGYEKGKALGAVEYLEPRSTWIFVPNSPEIRYLSMVQKHNKELLRQALEKQFHYNVLSPIDTYFTLLSLVTGMRSESRPILLPFGPKLFFVLALLVALIVEEAAVWFVDGDDAEIPIATVPSEFAILMSCVISNSIGNDPAL